MLRAVEQKLGIIVKQREEENWFTKLLAAHYVLEGYNLNFVFLQVWGMHLTSLILPSVQDVS